MPQQHMAGEMVGQCQGIVGGRFVGGEEPGVGRAAGQDHGQHRLRRGTQPSPQDAVAGRADVIGQFQQREKLLIELKRPVF